MTLIRKQFIQALKFVSPCASTTVPKLSGINFRQVKKDGLVLLQITAADTTGLNTTTIEIVQMPPSEFDFKPFTVPIFKVEKSDNDYVDIKIGEDNITVVGEKQSLTLTKQKEGFLDIDKLLGRVESDVVFGINPQLFTKATKGMSKNGITRCYVALSKDKNSPILIKNIEFDEISVVCPLNMTDSEKEVIKGEFGKDKGSQRENNEPK